MDQTEPPPNTTTGNLPGVLSSFIGRRGETLELVDAVERNRLVTVAGPAGIGKTRLAVEVARLLGSGYPGGAWFVDLSTASGSDDVARAVAASLGARELPHRGLLPTLVTRLGTDRLLLLLDNCEHVLGDCGTLVELLLASCPRLTVLSTSREPMGVAGEFVRRLDGLAVVSPAAQGCARGSDDAVELFLTRAASAGAPAPAAGDPAVTEICRRLDGVPLAIEMAAAWVRCLTPTEIAERLDYSLQFLTRGHRASPPRHRTLRAAIEWSFDLLGRDEQTLLRRLAVFSHGWTVAAAEAVCSDSPLDAGQVLGLLAELADKSMVVRETLVESASRFRLLDTVREYAREKLRSAGEEAQLRDRHLAWCIELTELAERGLRGAQQVAWLRRIDAELPNVGAASEWALHRKQGDSCVRLAANLTLFWLIRGRMVEGLERLESSLSAAGDSVGRAYGLWGVGLLAWMLGDLDRAWLAGQESLDLFQGADDVLGTGRSLGLLGMVEAIRNPPGARGPLEESVRLAREAGDAWTLASSLGMLGYAAVFQGEFAAAARPFEESVAVARRAGDLQGLRVGLLGLGWVALQRGSTDAAARALEEGLEVARCLGDPVWTAVALVYLGELARRQDDSTAARTCFEEAAALARTAGASAVLGFCLAFLGHCYLDDGENRLLVEARTLFEEVVSMAPVVGNRGNMASAYCGLGQVAQTLGDLRLADMHYQQALHTARSCGDKLAAAQALLGLGRFYRARADLTRAADLCHEALTAHLEIGSMPGVVETVEALAGLALDGERVDTAARLFGAVDGIRRRAGFAALPPGHADVAALAKLLGDERLSGLLSEGSALSSDEAVAYARRSRGARSRPRSGCESLSPTEMQVVELAAQALTNREIGGRLFMSPRTVQTHLAHAFAKLGIHSRRELASLLGHDGDSGRGPIRHPS